MRSAAVTVGWRKPQRYLLNGDTMDLRVKHLLILSLLAGSPVAAQTTETVDAGRGPVTVRVPTTYNPAEAAPLLILLHGYTFDADLMEGYFNFAPLAQEHGFIYTYPDGTLDSANLRFWNATSACCDMEGSGVDDVGYLNGLLNVIESQYNIDPQRVHVVGHSNGGFMAYRLACESAGRFASIVSFAGAALNDPAACTPGSALHTLQIHGTLDPIVSYFGGFILDFFPSATETAEQWATHNGCSLSPISGSNINLDGGIFGNETGVLRWETGCSAGGSSELWTINLGGHLPVPSSEMSPLIFQFLIDHPGTDSLQFVRGDIGGDLGHDLSDVILLLQHLFSGALIDCLAAADINDDTFRDISDAVYLLEYLFGAGTEPPPPFPGCGSGPAGSVCSQPPCP